MIISVEGGQELENILLQIEPQLFLVMQIMSKVIVENILLGCENELLQERRV